MNKDDIRTLCRLNNDFYLKAHESFSDSRKMAWRGWQRVADHVPCCGNLLQVLDVASGNLRFERFLLEALPERKIEFTCIDSCPGFVEVPEQPEATTCIHYDVVEGLLSGTWPSDSVPGLYQLGVSFGFMHHIPTESLRRRFMQGLIDHIEPGGIAAFSFWRFMDEPSLAEKARNYTERGVEELGITLEENDYLLGWDRQPGLYRYCHHFDDAEIDSLTSCLSGVEVIDRYNCDGRNGALNGYVIVQSRRSI